MTDYDFDHAMGLLAYTAKYGLSRLYRSLYAIRQPIILEF